MLMVVERVATVITAGLTSSPPSLSGHNFREDRQSHSLHTPLQEPVLATWTTTGASLSLYSQNTRPHDRLAHNDYILEPPRMDGLICFIPRRPTERFKGPNEPEHAGRCASRP